MDTAATPRYDCETAVSKLPLQSSPALPYETTLAQTGWY